MAAEAMRVKWGWPQMELILQCPVCMELPIGPVPICNQGHHVCTTCRQQIEFCPLCKARYTTEARNFAIEELLANIAIIRNLMTLSDVTTEEQPSDRPRRKSQTSRIINLPPPVQSRGEYPCAFCPTSLPVSRMLVHTRFYHQNSLIEVPYTQPFQITIELKYILNNSSKVAIKAEKLGLFFLNLEVHATGKCSLFLRMVASHQDAQKYNYSLKIPHESTNYFGRVMSCREPVPQIIKKKNCLSLDLETVQKHKRIMESKKLIVIVTISRTDVTIEPPTNLVTQL